MPPEMSDSEDEFEDTLKTPPSNNCRNSTALPRQSAQWAASRRISDISNVSVPKNNSFRTSLRAHSNRCAQSILHGAVDLRHRKNAIEAPEEDSWTVDVDGRSVTFALMNNVTKPPKLVEVIAHLSEKSTLMFMVVAVSEEWDKESKGG